MQFLKVFYKNEMGRTCVVSRRICNKINNDLDVSGKETKGRPRRRWIDSINEIWKTIVQEGGQIGKL